MSETQDDASRELLRAASVYFRNYCLDEADENGEEYTGCGREQHLAAVALGKAIAALSHRALPAQDDSFGHALAMRVLQSTLYPVLDDQQRAECDELIARARAAILQREPKEPK